MTPTPALAKIRNCYNRPNFLKMRVLVACEFSGVVRDAFRRRGHEAWSCDLLGPDDVPEVFRGQEYPNYHLEGDVRLFLGEARWGKPWDLMIAHPPCTYLCSSGLHWNTRIPGRAEKTEEALQFVRDLLSAPIPRICLENPIGRINTAIRKPDQVIQPWQFGHPESKQTALWLKGLPDLQPTNILTPPRHQKNGQPQWDNQTPSGQNKLGPSADRWKLRSATYRGIAEAMASQWGSLAPVTTLTTATAQ